MTYSHLHDASQLALAAYGLFENAGSISPESLTKLNGDTKGFSELQAAAFASRHEIALSTYSDPTSLEATVFRELETGNLTLAIRGTQQRFEDPSDLDDCLSIAEYGMATEQIVALFNFVSRITAAPGTMVPQYSLTASLRAPSGHSLLYYSGPFGVYLSKPTYVAATGAIFKSLGESASKMLTITGSSLGGHLTIAAATLFPALTDRAYAFNAPGFGPHTGVQRLFSLLGASRPSSPAALSPDPGNKIINIVSSEALDEDERYDLIAGMWGYPGDGVIIGTEDQTLSDVTDAKQFSWNHDQRQVTDSFAVYAALNKLDPSLELPGFSGILRAAASGENRSLENIVDSLERALGIDSAQTPAGNSNRDHLYQALDRLAKAESYAALSGKITIRMSGNNMAALAGDDFGSFLGLSLLDAVHVESIAGQESSVEAVLAAPHRTLYESWNRDRQLTLAQRENGEETFTPNWLRDRAAMLEIIALRNTHNIEKIGTAHDPRLTVRINYEDVPSNELLFVGDKLVAPQLDVRFGSDGADHFAGSSASDAFYGGSGSDTLEGGAGTDRLEGNAGDDRLLGGEGVDTLLGGAGNDVLSGGGGNDSLLGGTGDDELNGDGGNDVLRGGPGNDSYRIKAGGGHDEISDSDSIGKVEVEGLGLIDGKGALKLSASSWLAADLGVLYSLTNAGPSSANLHLTFAGGGTLTISNWRNGGLGITLGNTAPTPPSWQYFTGDFIKKLDTNEISKYAFNGYNYVSAGVAAGAMDLIHGADVSSHISGGGGNDGLAGMAASDLIEGGDGDDLLLGNLGADTLIGGEGNDLIHGSGAGGLEMPLSPNTPPIVAAGPEISRGLRWVYYDAGPDQDGIPHTMLLGADSRTLPNDAGNLIDAGGGNDNIFAGSGYDIVYGRSGDDEIKGLGGSDVLEGDEGNDTISGDGSDLPGYIDSVSASLHGADLINGGAGDDSLTGQGGSDWIHGGLGNDRLFGDESNRRSTPWDFHGGDHLDGGDGSDELIGDGGSDTLIGGEGNDSLFGDASTSNVAGSHHGEDLLEGGAGDDYLQGGGRADTLLGGADNDMLWGDVALDTLQAGEAGADWLDGGAGADTLVGGAAADTLIGGDGNDHLTGDGANVLAGEHGDDIIDGGAGSDTLVGDGGSDALYGGEHDDLLIGGDGDDLLVGGGGTDRMEGGAGNDVYLIGASPLNSRGEAETILDHEGKNQFLFETFGSTTTQVAVMPNGNIQFTSPSGDALLVAGGAADPGNSYEFSDGAQFDTVALIQNLSVTAFQFKDSLGREQATGGRENDLLTTTSAHATLSGGRGNDRLQASGGNNSYHYRLGDGTDTIVDTSVALGLVQPAQRNRIVFGADIVAGDLRLTNSGGSGGFRIQVGVDSDDSITLGEFDASSSSPVPINAFQFADGSELSFAQLASLGFEGGIGDDTLTGTAFNDRLTGHFGDDLLAGGAGADTYHWAPGGDADTIVESPGSLDDTLAIGGSITAGDLSLLRSGNDLIIRLREDASQQVVVVGQFAGERIERLTFDDGTAWNHATMVANLANALSAGDDTFTGTSAPDQIHAQAGNDLVSGLGGGDLIDGGPGRDTLYGEQGNDTLLGDADDDWLDGADGNDRLDGGQGRDTLLGAAGDDTLIGGAGEDTLSAGDGNDLLIDGADMQGGFGSDTYELTSWRSAVIDERADDPAAIDRLLIPFASSSANVGISLYGGSSAYDLLLSFGNMSESVKVKRYFESPTAASTIEAFTFSDGVTWTVSDIHAHMPVNRTTDGNDRGISGFSWNDVIDAKGGNDQVFGNHGNDSITGAAGDDVLYGNQGDDTLLGGTGADHLYGDTSYTMAEDGHDRLEGGSGMDTLQAGGGNDTLDGGSGGDQLLGGSGDDSYLIDATSGSDQIEDASGSDSIALGSGISQSRVALFADGKDLVVTIDQTVVQTRVINHYGNAAVELIRFADGSSWDAAAIDARVKFGVANAMTGSSANNSFVVDHADDTINEATAQGIDSVQSSVSYVLPTNVENLTLTGFVHLRGTGNALDNLIVGNAGNNHLDGLAGYDTLRGGAGDDVYRIDPRRDTVVELAGQGTDTVLSEWDYVLPEHVENLSSAPYWYRPISLTGNAAANVITAVDPSYVGNVIDGGAGADTMISYAPGAIFHVDDPGDILIAEAASVVSALDWTLAPGWRDLVLVGAADHGTGNAGPNGLIGSSHPDRLEGLDGDDSLYGALGFWSKQSTFYYDSWGPDTLVGGRGNDWYDIDWNETAHDVVIELPGEGLDTVEVRGMTRTYDLAEFPNVENLYLSGSEGSELRGNAGANRLRGNGYGNLIDGGAGDDSLEDKPYLGSSSNDHDTLLGGEGNDNIVSRSGSDVIDGGPGNDTISVAAESLSTVLFHRGSGHDVVHASPMASPMGRSLVMGAGIRPSDLLLTRDGSSLRIGVSSSPTDSLMWNGLYADETSSLLAGSLGSVEFADGVILHAEQLALRAARALPNLATPSADVLLGGAGSDLLSGLAGDDIIDGSDGADDLRGGPGADTLYGGAGDDTFRFDRGDGRDLILDGRGEADVLIFGAGIAPAEVSVVLADHHDLWLSDMLTLRLPGGTDELIVGEEDGPPRIDSVRFSDGTTWSAEMLMERATRIEGTAGADTLTGGDRNDRIFGLGGNDSLHGGDGDDLIDGGLGSDRMFGENGDDHYMVDVSADVVVEVANQGHDTVSSSVTYALTAHVEVLKLTGTGALGGTGNTLANQIEGNAGNNLLDGAGGADTMSGGFGDDSYKVDSTLDQIIELAGEGTDLVTSSVLHTLAPHVENLTLTGSAPLNGYGNGQANLLIGNTGNNRLEGGAGDDTLDGAAGIDAMFGGTGNDRYVVGSTSDSVTEQAGEGTDLVLAGVNWTLGPHVENLTLTGTSNYKGTGNALDNHLIGNSGSNDLNGGEGHDTLDGGAGNDSMRGGAGNDIYHVNTTSDRVYELANQGIDEIIAPVAWTLGDNLEHLTLTGSTGVKGTGNALANRLTGNSGANLLSGLAGSDTLDGAAGNDTLAGGAGADTYLFGRGSGVDQVQENDATAGVRDIVMLQAALTRNDLRFARTSNNLEMTIAGTFDKMVFQNWYLGAAYHAEEFRFGDGSFINDAEAQSLVGAMAAFGASSSTASTAPLQPDMTIGRVDYTSNAVW